MVHGGSGFIHLRQLLIQTLQSGFNSQRKRRSASGSHGQRSQGAWQHSCCRVTGMVLRWLGAHCERLMRGRGGWPSSWQHWRGVRRPKRAGDGEKRAAVLALMKASGEEGRRAGEEQLRCGMLRGWRCPFIGAGRGAQAVVNAVG
jgi:hypothetical protein